jgi:hypothetical protein
MGGKGITVAGVVSLGMRPDIDKCVIQPVGKQFQSRFEAQALALARLRKWLLILIQ